MKTFTAFNTGRPYASNGQVICAVLDKDESSKLTGTSVWFYDRSRCIVGKLPDTKSLADYVIMQKYDRLQYEGVSMSDPQIRAIVEYYG